MTYTGIYPTSLIYVAVFALLTWLVSRVVGDASIADVFWGLGFVGLAWLTWAIERGSLIVPILITIWGLRLALHIGVRNYSQKPDFRYENMRLKNPQNWWWWSFFKVFLLQASLLWIIGLVVIEGTRVDASQGSPSLIALGIGISLIGIIYESIADYQLTRFRSLQRNGSSKARTVLTTGLWQYSRHPNYFGEFVFWWGLFLTIISYTDSFWTVISPLLISFLLFRVSGVTMLEKGMLERKPAYAEYVEKMPSFFPRLRR